MICIVFFFWVCIIYTIYLAHIAGCVCVRVRVSCESAAKL